MTIHKLIIAVGMAFCMQAAQADTIIDNTFAKGNGSFEFDAAGSQLIGGTVALPGTPGLWGNSGANASLTIDGTDSIVGVNGVRAVTDSGASDGTHALFVRSGPYANGGSYGGFLNTGYTVSESDEFTLSFDWTISNNQLGLMNFEVYLFTSSDDTLSGTLTSMGSTRISQGGAVSGFQNVTLNDLAANAANIGQQVWVSVTPDGFSANGLNEIAVVDNINLTVIPEPATLGLVAVFGGGVIFMRRLMM